MTWIKFNRHNELLQYIIDYKATYGGDSFSIDDMAQAMGVACSAIWSALRTLQSNGKIAIHSFGIRKVTLTVICGPTLNGFCKDNRSLDFGAGRATFGDGDALCVEVHRTFVASSSELRELGYRLIAASDRIDELVSNGIEEE